LPSIFIGYQLYPIMEVLVIFFFIVLAGLILSFRGTALRRIDRLEGEIVQLRRGLGRYTALPWSAAEPMAREPARPMQPAELVAAAEAMEPVIAEDAEPVRPAASLHLHGHYITLFRASESVLLFWLYLKSQIRITGLASALTWFAMLLSLLMDWVAVYGHVVSLLPVFFNKGLRSFGLIL
jgi:hypothetical protein